MNLLEEIQTKIKRKNQILLTQDSAFLADLRDLIELENHKTLILWALEFAEESVKILVDRYPNEHRFELAVHLVRDWAEGKVKMDVAKHAILQVHAFTKEITSLEDKALCHAIGQACSVVHTRKHALGFPIYDLTAIIRHYGLPKCEEFLVNRKQHYIDRIYYWSEHYTDENYQWADFLLKR